MLYGKQKLYSEEFYEAFFISGHWIQTIPFVLEIGMATRVNVSWNGISPPGSRLFAEASGDDQLSWQKINNGEDCYIFFNTQDSGSKNLYLKMGFETSNPEIIPYYSSVTVNIYQIFTVYRLFYDILISTNLSPSKFWIDPEFFEFLIPYPWVKRSSHFDALNQVIKFCLAQIYVDRNDVIRIEGPNYHPDSNVQLTLTPKIYTNKTPVIKSNISPNEVLLYATPFSLSTTTEEIYRSGIPENISIGETKIITAIYSVAQTPTINCSASILGEPAGLSIVSEEYFTWGARIKVFSTVNTLFVLVIDGYELRIKGRIPVTKTKYDTLVPSAKGFFYSEKLYGELLYSIHDLPEFTSIRSTNYTMNHLLQTYEIADKIAGIIVSKYGDSGRSFNVEYPGHPALTLNDTIALGNIRNANTDNYCVKNHELIFSKDSLKGKLLVSSF